MNNPEKHSIDQLDMEQIQEIFDPQLFRKQAEIIISKLESYLSDRSIRGLDLQDPAELTQIAKCLMNDGSKQSASTELVKLEKIIDLYIKTGIQVHSPGFMGRQFSGIIPLSGVIDMVGTIVNQPASFYEAGQLPNVVERLMATELNKFIGWQADSFDMVSTSGGSLANLTAILAARNERFPEILSDGYAAINNGKTPAIAISEDCHYSIHRAISILGIGENQIIKLPVDQKRRIDIARVEPILDKAEGQGATVFCLVASAGNTSVGAVDPLEELAVITGKRNIWLHVDGAHGASFLISDKLQAKVKGLSSADSFAWDAHKMLFVPSMCTLLFYKNRQRATFAFNQSASYVFEKEPDIYTCFDSAEKNFECTKRPVIMNLWATWAIYGRSVFADKIDYLYELTQSFYQLLLAQDDFETIHEPDLNIICFRYIPHTIPRQEISLLQDGIRKILKHQGKFFISKVDLDGMTSLRVVFMNHLTTTEHCDLLLAEIRATGEQLMSGGASH